VAREDSVDRILDVTVTPGDWFDDEDLPEPHERDWTLLRRISRPIGALAVVALVAWGIAALASFADSPRTAAVAATSAPTTHVRPNDLAGMSVQVKFPGTGTAAEIITNKDLGTLCPPLNSCATTRLLPPDAVAAMRAVFPAMRISSATTVAYIDHHDGHRSLWYRSVHAASPGREIDINIVPITPGDHVDSGAVQDGAGVQVYTHRLFEGYVVQILVHFAGHVLNPIGALHGLPGDHRLLALR
jgi:hypothetical protein